jgi:acyl carrier protein
MELQELVGIFNEVLNKEGNEVINGDTQFKECDHWDSMSAFEIAEKIHDKFGMRLKGIQIRKCTTIAELYNSLG